MVTLEMFFAGVGSAILLISYFILKFLGYFIAIPVGILLVAWLLDYFKGTEYTPKIFNLFKLFIPKRKDSKSCPTCAAENVDQLPEEYNYCYSCGRGLAKRI